MNTNAIAAAVHHALQGGNVPGIVVAVSRPSESLAFVAEGSDAAGTALAADTLFPVASVTKMATALAVLRLCDQGQLALDDPLEHHVPEAQAAAQPGVTLRALLCHTAGLPIDVSPRHAAYAKGLDWPALSTACLLTAPDAPAGKRVQYSNVGYGLLALAVERRTEQAFPAALRDLVLGPLGISATLGSEPPFSPTRLAQVRGCGHFAAVSC